MSSAASAQLKAVYPVASCSCVQTAAAAVATAGAGYKTECCCCRISTCSVSYSVPSDAPADRTILLLQYCSIPTHCTQVEKVKWLFSCQHVEPVSINRLQRVDVGAGISSAGGSKVVSHNHCMYAERSTFFT
jgi:hypothetical protein